jgi:hypothetical protein
MGNCRDALVWLYHAEIAGPAPDRKGSLDSLIDTCQNEVKKNLP